MPSKTGDPRWTAEWKRLRRRLVASATHCAACGGALVKDGPARGRWSPSVDHILSVRTHPHLALDPANCRVLHASCNTKRENTSRRGDGRYHGGPRHWQPAAQRQLPRPWHSRKW
jgi:5-methylcytosine-specific restriction endonuclease McrA